MLQCYNAICILRSTGCIVIPIVMLLHLRGNAISIYIQMCVKRLYHFVASPGEPSSLCLPVRRAVDDALRAPLPTSKEPIQPWMGHLTSSTRDPRGTCLIHIGALGSALFVCAQGASSLGHARLTPLLGCRRAYVSLVFQVKLSFNLARNWEWRRQGSV